MNKSTIIRLSLFLLVILIMLILAIVTSSNEKFNNLQGYNNYGYQGLCNLNETNGNIICFNKETQKVFQKDDSINKNDIINLYNDLSYSNINDEELPNGGLLVSMITNNYACGSNSDGVSGRDYHSIIPQNDKNKSENDKLCVSIDECKLVDFKDIGKLLSDTANENQTSCYALDTTYMRTDFPSLLFGPLIENDTLLDMNIGLIFDIRKLRQYIGCMSIIDSGSVGRYNREESKSYKKGTYIPTISQGDILKTTITDNEIKNKYSQLLNSDKGRGLAQAGCGLQTDFQGSGLSGIFNDEVLPTGAVNKFKGANKVIVDKYNKKISPFKTHNELIYGQWGINSLPLKRSSWKYFINLIKDKVALIKKYKNSRLWQKVMKLNNSGTYVNKYFENEVDIFIPNKLSTGGDSNCQPTDEFKEIWKDCIIGIFTNNRCLSDVNNNKPCNNCGKLQSFDCNKDSCCCNKEFNENLVQKLVYKFNSNNSNIINGYIMNDDFNPSHDYPEPQEDGNYKLSIRQITDCKSYYIYPVEHQIINAKIPLNVQNVYNYSTKTHENYKQYWYYIDCNNQICGPNDTKKRSIGITIPENFNGKYLINLDFTIDFYATGYACADGTAFKNKFGGVVDFHTLDNFCKKKNENSHGWGYGYYQYQEYLHYVLSLGMGIIHLTECEYDYGAYIEGKDPDLKRSGKCSLYWDNGNNSTARYLKSVFRDIYCNNFVDNDSKQIKFIYDDIGILGYSIGAQLVSRFYNEFPSMITYPNNTQQTFKFPIIKYGMMIAGGTTNCYYDPKRPNYCPPGTEPLYDNNEYNMVCHPYTLLLQSDRDSFADHKAAEKYYTSFPKNLQGEYVKSNRDYIMSFNQNKIVYCHYSVNSTIHGLTNDAQVKSMINFTKEFM